MKYLKFTLLLLCINQLALGITAGNYSRNAVHSHKDTTKYGYIMAPPSTLGLGQSLTDLFFWGMNVTENPSNKYPKALSFSLSNFQVNGSNLLNEVNKYAQNNVVIIKITITNTSANRYTAQASAIILAPYSFTPLEWIDPIEIDLSTSISNPLKIGYIAAYVGDMSKYNDSNNPPPAYAGLGTQGKFTSQNFTIDNNFSNSIFITINNGHFAVTTSSSHKIPTSDILEKNYAHRKKLPTKFPAQNKINTLNQELLEKISQLAALKNSSCMQGPAIGGEAGAAKRAQCLNERVSIELTLLQSCIDQIDEEIEQAQKQSMSQLQPF